MNIVINRQRIDHIDQDHVQQVDVDHQVEDTIQDVDAQERVHQAEEEEEVMVEIVDVPDHDLVQDHVSVIDTMTLEVSHDQSQEVIAITKRAAKRVVIVLDLDRIEKRTNLKEDLEHQVDHRVVVALDHHQMIIKDQVRSIKENK